MLSGLIQREVSNEVGPVGEWRDFLVLDAVPLEVRTQELGGG
jgi:hypothetical protein